MYQAQEIWKKRVKAYWKMAIRYLSLIGNSGFLFAIYIAIFVGSYYYSELLKWLPVWFPDKLFLALVTAFLLTNSPIRPFVKQGDLVFLSPVEGKLNAYFRASYYYSFFIQSIIILFVMILLAPLYRHFNVAGAYSLLFIIVVLFTSKAWNLLVQWEEGRLLFTNSRLAHKIGRFMVNIVLTYLLFIGAVVYFLIAGFVIKGLLLFCYYQHVKKHHSLKWEYLIEIEERMVMSFYRIANMFTDVPKLQTKVRKRRLISSIPNLLPFNQNAMFTYLYMKSFIRANDYFGIYVRLLLIGIALICYVQFPYGKVFIALLIVYMSGLQLLTLWNHHTSKIWLDLYPIDFQQRKKSFSLVVFFLLTLKTVLFTFFTLIASTQLIDGLLVLGIGFTESYFFAMKGTYKGKKETP